MTIMEPIDGTNPSTNLICPRCSASLPSQALFCSLCGERIKKKKNEEWEVLAENRDDNLHEQELDDTLRIPSLARTRLQSYRSVKSNGSTEQTYKSSSLSQDVEAPTFEQLPTPSTPVPDIDTEKREPVALAQPLEQQITQLPAIVNTPDQQIAGALGSTSGATRREDTLIWRSWLLARSLVQRVLSNSLLRNSIYIMGTGIATSVFGFLFWILADHLYSIYDVGLGAALISAMTLASIFANLGMGGTLVQMLPRREAGYAWSLTLNAGLATGIVAGLLSGTITLMALPLFSHQFAIVENHVSYALAFVAGVPLMTLSMLLDQAFIAERAAHNMLIRNVAVAVLKIPLMVLPVVLLIQVGALGIFGSGVVAMGVALFGGLLLLIPGLRRAYCLAARGIVVQVRSMLSSLTGNYFITLGGLATPYLLPVFVAARLSPADNAYYYNTTRVGDFILLGSAAVASSLFAEGSHGADDLPRKVRSSAKIIAMILGPGILVCYLGGSYILSVFGQSYAQHGLIVLRIEALASIPDAITSVYVSVLRVQRRLRFAALLNLGMAMLTLILAWILLPMLGIAAVPVSVLLSQGAGSVAAGVDFIRIGRHRGKISGATLMSDSDCAEAYQNR